MKNELRDSYGRFFGNVITRDRDFWPRSKKNIACYSWVSNKLKLYVQLYHDIFKNIFLFCLYAAKYVKTRKNIPNHV